MKKILLLLLTICLASMGLAQYTTQGFPNPNTPAGLKLAVTMPGVRIKNQKREYMAGPIRYAAGKNGAVPSPMFNIVNATNASPIVFTTDKAHGFNAGDSVTVAGIVGNTNGNTTGTVSASNLTTTTFSLTSKNGNAAYGDIVGVPGGATCKGPLTSGESADIFYLSGGAVITSLQIISGDTVLGNDFELWIYCAGDSEAAPTTKIPFMNLIGKMNGMAWNTGSSAFDQYNLKFGNADFRTPNYCIEYCVHDDYNNTDNTSGVQIQFLYPMPNVERITIFNPDTGSDGAANLYTQVHYTTDVKSTLKLRASNGPAVLGAGAYASNFANFDGADTAHSYDLLNLGAGNAGWIVGEFFKITSAFDTSDNSELERDFSFRRDGETNPSWITSGSEDLIPCAFFNQGRVTMQGLNGFIMFNRPAGTNNGAHAAAAVVWSAFKDLLTSDNGLAYSNGAIWRWELAPDTARVLGNASLQHTTLYYSQ